MKKLLSILLSALLLITSAGTVVTASDYSGHWAEAAITSLISSGVVSGDDTGSVRPDENILRSEFVKIINKYFGYTKKADDHFVDVDASKWYAAEFQIAKAEGYLSGDEYGNVNPEASITRAEVCVILSRILKLEDAESTGFADSGSIPVWARGAVGALYKKGLISGYADGTVQAENNITRAEAFTLLTKAEKPKPSDNPDKITEDGNSAGNISVLPGSGGNGGSGSNGGSSRPSGEKKAAVDVRKYDPVSYELQFTAVNAASFQLKITVDGTVYLYPLSPKNISGGYECNIKDIIRETVTKRAANEEKYNIAIEAFGKSGAENSGALSFFDGIVALDFPVPQTLTSGYKIEGTVYNKNIYVIGWDAVTTADGYQYLVYDRKAEGAEPVFQGMTTDTFAEVDLTSYTGKRAELFFVVKAKDAETQLYSVGSEEKKFLMDGPVITNVIYHEDSNLYEIVYQAVEGAESYEIQIGTSLETSTKNTCFIDVKEGAPQSVSVRALCASNESVPSEYAFDFSFGGGTGTEQDPYLIGGTRHFKNIADKTGASYKLTKDIDLTNCGYTPLSGFAGILDGNGHTIKLAVTGLANAALFQTAAGAAFQNLTVDGAVSGTTNAAGFVGNATSSLTFENCVNKAKVSGAPTVGGFVADAHTGFTGSITVKNSANYGTITASGPVGAGFLGKVLTMNITNSVNYGDVYATMRVAGFVGWHTGYSESHVDNCANFGNITCTSEQSISGPAGIVSTTCSGTVITNCFNAGSATLASGTPANYCAGIASMIHSTKNVSISNCLSIGTTKSAVYSSTNSVTPNILSNNYYLSGSCTDAGDASASAKTDTELKDSAMLTLLGEQWAFQNGYDYPLPIGITYASPGEPEDEKITTAEQFMEQITDNATGVYKLGADFILPNDYAPRTGFAGTLDGNGHTITVNISSTTDKIGLFATAGNGAVIKNLTVAGSVSGKTGVGGFVGELMSAENGITIENCVNRATVTGSGARIGGFIGNGHTCAKAANVKLTDLINFGDITCTFVGGHSALGGIAGIAWAQFKNCQNYGKLTVSDQTAGGIVGWTYGSNAVNCANFGTIEGTSVIYGGIIGLNSGASSIQNCLNAGSIETTNENKYFLGGLLGNAEKANVISNSLSIKTGSENVQALAGLEKDSTAISSNVTITNSYYLSGLLSAAGIAKTEEELKDDNMVTALGNGWIIDASIYEYPLPDGIRYQAE